MDEVMLVEPYAYGRSHWHWVLGDRSADGYRLRACHGTEFELHPLKGRAPGDLEGMFPCQECEAWGLERGLPDHASLMGVVLRAGERVYAASRQMEQELSFLVPGTAPEPGQLSCGGCGQEFGTMAPADVLAFTMGHQCPSG